LCPSYRHYRLQDIKGKKGKGRSIGAFQHWCLQAYCILTPEFTPSSPEALHTKLSASEGANYILRNLANKSVIFGRTRFFYMPQSWDMGQIILLPLRRKACYGFFQPEKSDGFGRKRTRDLGYQRPACKPLDHRSRFAGYKEVGIGIDL
jgi:hypothetical protein